MKEFNVKVVASKGFTKEEALATEKIGFNALGMKGSNSTQAWTKAGKPTYGTPAFKQFAVEQLKAKTRGTAGVGGYVVVEAGISDSRERPYRVLSVTNEGTRKFTMTYQIVEAELETKTKTVTTQDEEGNDVTSTEMTATVKSLGAVVANASKKSEAEALLKDYITSTKRDYIINVVKLTDHNPIAAYGVYTPSSSTKEGTYLAFGVELV